MEHMDNSANIEHLRRRLAALGFDQVSDETLQRVQRDIGVHFARLMDVAEAGAEPKRKDATERVRRALTCASPTVTGALSRLGVVARVGVVVAAAKANPDLLSWVAK